jgi:hypothetical protein
LVILKLVSTAQEYEQRARALDDSGLRRLWSAIKACDTPDWPAGKAFEYMILRAFELERAKVRYPYSVRVQGEVAEQIDGVIYSEGLSVLVEAKDQSLPLNVEPLAKLRNQLLRRPGGTIGMIFSRSGFTDPAQILAGYMAPTTILLWEEAEIELALKTDKVNSFCRGLRWKYRRAVEEGIAFSDLTAFLSEASP